MARRFTREPNWRGWAAYSMITAILVVVLITLVGVLDVNGRDYTGLVQRLGVINPNAIWGLLFFTRLWMGAGFGAFQRQDEIPART